MEIAGDKNKSAAFARINRFACGCSNLVINGKNIYALGVAGVQDFIDGVRLIGPNSLLRSELRQLNSVLS